MRKNIVVVNGVRYPSISSLCRFYGANRSLLYNYLRKGIEPETIFKGRKPKYPINVPESPFCFLHLFKEMPQKRDYNQIRKLNPKLNDY